MDVHTEKDHHRETQKEQKESKEQGSRPRAGSESSRNPVSKVMDLIRHRSHSALSAEDKRKAVSDILHSLPTALERSYSIESRQKRFLPSKDSYHSVQNELIIYRVCRMNNFISLNDIARVIIIKFRKKR